MLIGPLLNVAGGLVQSLLPTSSNSHATASPFTQILGSLQQLRQPNPAQYQSATAGDYRHTCSKAGPRLD